MSRTAVITRSQASGFSFLRTAQLARGLARLRKSRRLEVVNVRNQGAVPNLPEDAVVEVTCALGSNGALPIAAGPLPFALQGIVRSVHESATLAVEAGLTGNRKLVLQAAMAHPAHRDFDTIEKVIAELFEAHRPWLPQFFKKGAKK